MSNKSFDIKVTLTGYQRKKIMDCLSVAQREITWETLGNMQYAMEQLSEANATIAQACAGEKE